ncbi:hypothetical protein AB205_0139210, partial [Aquarana catesbeiana]
MHKVPVLTEGEFTLVESTAMLRYLVQKYDTPDHWYPSDLQKRARVDEYLAWQHTNTRPNGCRVFWVKVVASGVPVFEQRPKLEAWKQRVEEALGPEVFKEAHEDILNVKEQQLNSLSPEMFQIYK